MLATIGAMMVVAAAVVEPFSAPDVTEVGAGVWRLRFGEPEAFTPDRFREREADTAALARLPEPGTLPFGLDEIRCRIPSGQLLIVKKPYTTNGYLENKKSPQ